MTALQTLTVILVHGGMQNLGLFEDVITNIVTKKPVATLPTTPFNQQWAWLGFQLYACTTPACLEQVTTFFTTHTVQEMIDMYHSILPV